MAGPATGWAQMTRRLLWSTTWRPERTIAFAAIGTRHVTGLVGAHNLTGLSRRHRGRRHLADQRRDSPGDPPSLKDVSTSPGVTAHAAASKLRSAFLAPGPPT